MKKMKRFLAMLLAVTLLSSTALFTTGASAASDRETKAQVLSALGLFKGYDNTGTNFGLSNGATREHAILFLIRMLGEESAAAAWTGAQPFSDVASTDYYYPYIGYAKAKGYTNGLGNNKFGLGQSANMKQMTAFALRGLGYSESAGDFTYQNSLTFAVSKGILDSATAPATFTRGNAVDVIFGATFSNMKNQNISLIEKLAEKGAVNQAQLDKANAILDGKTVTAAKSDIPAGKYTLKCLGNNIAITNGKMQLLSTTPAQVFTIVSAGDYSYIQTSNGYYVGVTSLKNATQLVTGTTPYSWLIQKISTGVYTIRPAEKPELLVCSGEASSKNGAGMLLWPHTDNAKHGLVTFTTASANVAVTGVKLDQTSVSVAVGKTYSLTGTISPSNATNQSVTWSSSATSIATVDSNGVVKGVKAGTATITVKTVDGSKTATCKVTVTAANTYTDKKVNLYNSTTQTVKGIYISSTQNKDWGSNLTSGTVAPNASVAILVPVSSTDYTYDIKLVYTDNSSAEFTGYNFKNFTSGGSLYAYIDKSTPMLSTTKPTVAGDTTAASKELTKRYNDAVTRFNTTKAMLETLGIFSPIKTEWESYANQLDSALGFIGNGTGVYTQTQIDTANAILTTVDTFLKQMDQAIFDAREAAANKPTSKDVIVTFKNGTNADFTGFVVTTAGGQKTSPCTLKKDYETQTFSFTIANTSDKFNLSFTESLTGTPYSLDFGFDSSVKNGDIITVHLDVEDGSVVYSFS